ncbi:MAG: hypothetical protein LLF76_10595 [Planctomycetaceae bacterium]|nr:hypothetical protein [Planctomycetaceae bacterium]
MAIALMLLFSRQIANIKVLDQVSTPDTFRGMLYTAGDRVVAPGLANVSISQDSRIRAESMPPSLIKQANRMEPRQDIESTLHYRPDGWFHKTVYSAGKSIYAYSFDHYYYEKEIDEKKISEYEKLELRISQFQDGRFMPLSFVDLSEFIIDKQYPDTRVRLVQDKLIIVVNKNILLAQIQDNGSLSVIERKVNQLARYSPHVNRGSFDKAFAIPLVPIEHISPEERIGLSIDTNFTFWWSNRSLVDISADGIQFCLVRGGQIEKYKVQRWDDKNVWCRFVERRPFTLLETLFGGSFGYNDWQFVKNGKLYVYGNHKLLVFDIRSGIRKLGHFERISETGNIEDVAVVGDAYILLSHYGDFRKYQGGYARAFDLYLLENPE